MASKTKPKTVVIVTPEARQALPAEILAFAEDGTFYCTSIEDVGTFVHMKVIWRAEDKVVDVSLPVQFVLCMAPANIEKKLGFGSGAT